MFGFFKKKAKPKSLLDELIFSIYGNPPPPKRACIGDAIAIADQLLMGEIEEKEIYRKAVELNDGPMPYSTHDLGLSVALHFFIDPDNIQLLFDAQLAARGQLIGWLADGLVAPMLVQSFESKLYELYKPEYRKPEVIIYDQDSFIEIDDGALAWVDSETGLMWEIKNRENFKFMYVWHSTYVEKVDENIKEKFNVQFEEKVRDCTSYIARMNHEKYAGFDDWRIPTIEELESLIDEKGQERRIKKPLQHISCPAYWSDSPTMVVNVYKIVGYSWKDTSHIPTVKIVDYTKPMTVGYEPSNALWFMGVRNM